MALSYAPWQISKLENGNDYTGAGLFYIGSNIMGLLLAIALYQYDKRKCEGVLNTPVEYWYYDYDYGEEGEEEEEEADIKEKSEYG